MNRAKAKSVCPSLLCKLLRLFLRFTLPRIMGHPRRILTNKIHYFPNKHKTIAKIKRNYEVLLY